MGEDYEPFMQAGHHVIEDGTTHAGDAGLCDRCGSGESSGRSPACKHTVTVNLRCEACGEYVGLPQAARSVLRRLEQTTEPARTPTREASC